MTQLPPDYERMQIHKLVESVMYEVRVKTNDVTVGFWLPFRGYDSDGWLTFGDGPNGIWVRPDDNIVTVYYDHIPY